MRSAAAFSKAADAAGVPVTRIGRITAGSAPPVVLGRDGEALSLTALAYDHFGKT
jgi:hypothetical protein